MRREVLVESMKGDLHLTMNRLWGEFRKLVVAFLHMDVGVE